jgi:HlyD family secretion protein
MKKLLFALLMMWVGGAAGLWYWTEGQGPKTSFRTVLVKRGDLLATINATGTLEPEEVVDVGAQIAGAIQSFGTDPKHAGKPVSYGTLVDQGTELARLDDSLFKARVNQAKASVEKADADVEQAEVKLRQAQRELDRVQRLMKTRSTSQSELEKALTDSEAAQANVSLTKSAVALAKANFEEATVNLGYTTIRSPVKGVVVDRRVNIGQTVVASLNAPSLFLIAKDLSRMQIWASVNETDVGSIHPGQNVKFTVAAYPRESFPGKVAQIRLNASMSQSVVTYTVVVEVDNSEKKLLPYLTARLQFEVDQRRGVLLLPNAALRWMPTVSQVSPAYRSEFSQALRRRAAAAAEKARPGSDKSHETRGTVWVRDDTFVRPVSVGVGLTDGLTSEITSGDLEEGTLVVVGLEQDDSGDASASPFMSWRKNSKAK